MAQVNDVPAHMEKELGWTPIRRLEEFDKRRNTPADETFRLTFADESLVLPIWVVPIQLPRYRLENGRTTSAQLEWLAKHTDLPKTYFRSDPESIEAQWTQHQILSNMINEADLRKLFKGGEIKQEEPLILDHNGFVVNGNRRLCLWRDLRLADKTKYSHFDHVRVVVLPERSPAAISKLEANLQVRRDVKAAYTWHALAHMFKAHRDHDGMTEKDIAILYDKNESAVKEYIAMLDAAERFLASRDKRDEWSAVDGDEFAFRKLVNSLDKVKAAPDKALFQAAAFNIVDYPKKEGRLYERVPDVQKHLPAIKKELQKRYNVTPAQGGHALLGGSTADIAVPLAKTIEDPANRVDATKVILATIEDQEALDDAKKTADAFVKLLTKANSTLVSAEMVLTEKTPRGGAAEQLNEIEATVKRLRQAL